MKRKTPQSLRADANNIRENCARMLVHADKLDDEAAALEQEERERREAEEAAAAELAALYFSWSRRVRMAH